MKTVSNLTRHYCDHCNKEYKVPHACIKHEAICSKNDINDRPCLHCSKLSVVKTLHYKYDEDGEEIAIMKCEKFNKFVHTPQVEAKGNAFLSEDLENELPNEPMPKECEHYNSHHDFYFDIWKK